MNVHLGLFAFILQWIGSSSITSSSPYGNNNVLPNYEQILDWNVSYQEQSKTLNTLQKLHNSSAILHFIELSHNFTAGDLTNCKRISLSSLNFTIGTQAYEQFNQQADIAIRTSHFLTNLFSSNIHNNHSLQHLITNKDFYWSLLLANLQSNSLIHGAGISFSNNFLVNYLPNLKHFSPYLFRNVRANDTIKINLTTFKHLESSTETFRSEWFWKLGVHDIASTIIQWNNVNVASLNQIRGIWTSPYLDCGITKTWLTSYIVPFFKINTVNSISQTTLVGLVLVSIDLNQVDINQCSGQNSFFSDTHKCHTPSTQCQNVLGSGFRRGAYYCKCRPGFYYPNSTSPPYLATGLDNVNYHNFFDGNDVEEAFIETIIGPIDKQNQFYPHNFICLPCEPGCSDCDDNSPCLVKFNYVFRLFVFAFTTICIIVVLLFAILIFKFRYTKRVAASRWVMLETILIGALMLYTTVILRYYESSTTTCFLEPWFREIGFSFCYGSIVIKVYRIYAEFQTRKAHRVCVRDKDLLKYLMGIVLIVFGYMSAWTALVIDGIDNMRAVNLFGNSFNFTSKNILDEKFVENGLKFYVCRQLAWDYVTEIGELLFLLSGVYLTYRIRNAKKEVYRERMTLTLAILFETTISFVAYLVKHAMWSHPSMHPDHILLLYFVRCHSTVTPTLAILFLPKFFYKRSKRSTHHRTRHLSSAEVSDTLPDPISIHSAILSNGEIDIGEINLSDMDPEDIRTELRRMYTQLQIVRNKAMRNNNPHVSKRRGGRKSHRRFSLQHFHHKHKHDQEVTEVSRTPEDSTASIDGNTASCVPDGPSIGKPDTEFGNSSTSNTTKSYTHKHP
ncbi:hypothetical protein BLOT_003753 [Blomia tropicalis]|nr:hypothetical protein BLOT_003753 [Blomia tropicalis]